MNNIHKCNFLAEQTPATGNTRERRKKTIRTLLSIYYIHNAYAGRYTRVSCNKQYVPHLSWSLFSERPEICTP